MTGISTGLRKFRSVSGAQRYEDTQRAMGRRWSQLWGLAQEQGVRLPSHMRFNSFSQASIRQLEELLQLEHQSF